MGRRILIADDEKEIRELLRLYLEKDGFEVVQAGNGLEALMKIKLEPIDLVIADIMMPGLDGYELIKRLREFSGLPVIVISAKTQNHEKILGLDLGADDYVTKPFDPLEVAARIKAQLRRSGQPGGGSLIQAEGGLQLDVSACVLKFGGETINLTATEFNIMKLFMESPNRVFTKQQIYEAAWQEESIVDDNTVMVAISKLRGKLPRGCPSSIRTIRGLGYRLEAL